MLIKGRSTEDLFNAHAGIKCMYPTLHHITSPLAQCMQVSNYTIKTSFSIFLDYFFSLLLFNLCSGSSSELGG